MKQFKFLIVSLFLINSQFFAQDEEMKSTLSDVVVSATKTETSTLEVASSFTIITSEQLEKLQNHSVIDALKLAEGMSVVQQGGPGRLSSIFMRGANSEHIMIMIDGVNVNDPSSVSNSYDIATLMTDNIERIEIIRGPQSTLYGSDAIAGIINIFTKSGSDKSNINFLAEGGSNNYYKGNLGLHGEFNFFNYSLSASRMKTDGISAISSKYGAAENDGYANTTISSRFGFDLSSNFDIDMSYRFIDGNTDLDQDGKDGDDPNFFYNVKEHIANAQLNGNFFDENWEMMLGTSYLSRDSDSQDDVDEIRPATSSRVNSVGNRLKFFWQNNLRILNNNTITIGIETENESAESDFAYYSEWGDFVGTFDNKSIRTTSLYLQDQLKYFNNLFGTIGIRYDNNEQFGSQITYRIAPAYFISSTSTKLKATYGTGFKAPSLFRLYDPTYGNTDLQPETSIGWDVGIEQFLFDNLFSVNLTYFNTQFENMFGFDENFKTININKVKTSGVEFSAELRSYDNFSAFFNYTYTNATDESPNVASENINLIRRPKQNMNLVLNYKMFSRLDLLVKFMYTGEREDIDFSTYPSTRVILKSYTLVDFVLSYQISDLLRLQGRIENIFDTEYEEVLYYGTLGRSGYIGVVVNL